MNPSYECDVVVGAKNQAALIRTGQFDQLDLAHIAEEIEDVGKREQRELASRVAVLLAHILKWKFQPQKRSVSWTLTIKEQRRLLVRRVQKMPSLSPMLSDPEWVDEIWVDAKALAEKETGLDMSTYPEICPWSMTDVLTPEWLPD